MIDTDNTLVKTLADFERAHDHVNRWVVAYSGGLDSTVLLHLLKGIASKTPVEAVHINHGLSELAGAWQQHCLECCTRWSIPLRVIEVQVKSVGSGIEDAARQARYTAFEKVLEAGDGLLLAHHQDDQAETLLLRLLRGSGPRGLASMAVSRELGKARLYRPLLELTRHQLEVYARHHQLSWIDDDSNASLEFDRNYLRHRVMPALKQRWPGAAKRFATSARHCAEAEQLMMEVAASDLDRAEPQQERLGESLAMAPLRQMSRFRRGNLLRHWLTTRGLPLPEEAHLAEFEQQLLNGRSDSEAEVSFGGVMLRRYRERLYRLAPLPDKVAEDCDWDGRQPLAWGGWLLSLEPVQSGGFRLPAEGFRVSRRLPGERCHPAWRQHSQTLKKLLQESEVEPWLRDRVPILLNQGNPEREPVAVGHLWPCKGWQCEAGETGFQLHWQSLFSCSRNGSAHRSDK
ncbi:tRNA lysidine(34) synthetase TilS [Pseudomaricurvus alkylphenolicus]|uniref:tRNA lysidine(34) synthetase TilS n=1 Tax=Pseudomaricurvus alkylphenolicus TaxID=1306991 RepID=UPI00142206B4|nr:tRNA lysidine(34) synthetase TilS [Pseudomaricurvus alkylphenolicus]NIB39803.1 tRNA lysidine(34) synthetase TilS [Pseudomaricurvus alkylphenolicus]